MAKAKSTTPEQEVGQTAQGEAQAATTTKKPKKERIFSSVMDLSDARKKEQQLTAKFNRLGRSVKKLGLNETTTNRILDILREEHKAQATAIFSSQPAEETAQAPAAESFV